MGTIGQYDYSGVSLPGELIKEVDKEVNNSKLGYRSRAEFIASAIREKLLQCQSR